MKKTKPITGFTLIEILLIVAILGILTAIIIPEYGNATVKGKNAALLSDLQLVRKQIHLYRLQHDGFLPGQGGNASWQQALTGYTNSYGDIYTSEMASAGEKKRGSYLIDIPVNPFNSLDTVRLDGDDAGVNTHGWRFDTVTGVFLADDNLSDESETPHSEL